VRVDQQCERGEADGAEHPGRGQQAPSAAGRHPRQGEQQRQAQQEPGRRLEEVDQCPPQPLVTGDGGEGVLHAVRVVGVQRDARGEQERGGDGQRRERTGAAARGAAGGRGGSGDVGAGEGGGGRDGHVGSGGGVRRTVRCG
jgi:hypothetical protein